MSRIIASQIASCMGALSGQSLTDAERKRLKARISELRRKQAIIRRESGSYREQREIEETYAEQAGIVGGYSEDNAI